MRLSLSDAEALADATLAAGVDLGKAFSVAVVDSGGFMLSVKRSDGARPLTGHIALTKAYTAAVMQRPSKMLEGWAGHNPTFFSQLSNLSMLPIVATGGGITVKRDGEIIGGLGVSGGTADEDEEIGAKVLGDLGYDLDFPAWGKPAGT